MKCGVCDRLFSVRYLLLSSLCGRKTWRIWQNYARVSSDGDIKQCSYRMILLNSDRMLLKRFVNSYFNQVLKEDRPSIQEANPFAQRENLL